MHCKPLGQVYYNPGNGYTVASYITEEELPQQVMLQNKNGYGIFQAFGVELPTSDRLEVELEGEWKKGKYGIQYQVSYFNIHTPTTEEGIRAYLSSNLIKGIGPVTAANIVDKFGKKTFYVLENGEAEIVRQFCMETTHKLETVRRLLTAELMGEFEKLKYHEDDLEREIAYPVPVEVEDAWKDNLSRSVDDCRIWEEDRFIPVLQIGEIPIHTCISYRGGVNKECLLSCFDANKKVIYLEKNGRIVFRALIRLTKGSVTEKPIRAKRVEFVDLTKENSSMEGIEELILFLERPYFGGISEEQENEVVSCAYQMVREKAKRMCARVVISKSYEKYAASKEYELMDYYVYISASKNGKQYMDSLYGEATVSDSGTYGKNKFLMVGTEKRERAA